MKLIGIDTGVHTGFALWDCEARKLVHCETCKLHEALIYVLKLQREEEHIIVFFEDARLRRWIPDSHDLKTEMGRRQGAGSVKRDASIWEEFCEGMGIDYVKVKPASGMTKWDAESFAKMTGWKGRTSNHARDAAMLVFGRSNNMCYELQRSNTRNKQPRLQ